MTEQIENLNETPQNLVETIYALRERINEERAFSLLDEIYHFDKTLKQEMVTTFGSTRLLQEISAWQALVGGSIEPEVSVTPEQKSFVEEKIKDFVVELKSKLD